MEPTNPNITEKELALIKGALRRVFARSEMHKRLVAATIVPDSEVPAELRVVRKRVKTWCRCPVCKELTAKSYIQIDHVVPIVPLDKTFHDIFHSVQQVADAIYCNEENLRAMCKVCHASKTSEERTIRDAHRRARRIAAKARAR